MLVKKIGHIFRCYSSFHLSQDVKRSQMLDYSRKLNIVYLKENASHNDGKVQYANEMLPLNGGPRTFIL